MGDNRTCRSLFFAWVKPEILVLKSGFVFRPTDILMLSKSALSSRVDGSEAYQVYQVCLIANMLQRDSLRRVRHALS